MVIIAAKNEERGVAQVVKDLREFFPSVVVVDDGSTDRTASEAESAGAQVLRHVINRGQGAAIQTGISWALTRDAQYVVTFDADGQHRPQDAVMLVEALESQPKLDVALGSRFLGTTVGMPLSRRLILVLGVWFSRVMSGLPLTDTHNGLRAFSAKAAALLEIRMDRMAHASEILDQIAAHRLSMREFPVEIRYSAQTLAHGQRSSGALKVLLEYFWGRVNR